MLLMQELQLKRLWLPFTLVNEESTLWRSLVLATKWPNCDGRFDLQIFGKPQL